MDPAYVSDINRGVSPASVNEFAPLRIGPLKVDPPVVLAPMAGVTDFPFRSLCRDFGAGLYVSEMIAARPLVEGRDKAMRLAGFGPGESPRSLQLYGTDPHYVYEAVRLLVGEGKVDHLDMNFGCPVPKVTRKGGGSAIPLKPNLLRSIVSAAVRAAEEVPVTIKFRLGTDDEHLTYKGAGQIAQAEGCKAVGLHARTAAQLYDGEARWEAIAELKALLEIPVMGNGDIWEAADALRMMRQTRCDGVIVGRGCLGRPWLFRDLADVFAGREPQNPPQLGDVIATMLKHARLLAEWMGEGSAMRAFRRHATWYLKGFRNSAAFRARLVQVSSLAELAELGAQLDPEEPFPASAMRVPRGKRAGTQKVVLPEGYLENLDDATPPHAADQLVLSGG